MHGQAPPRANSIRPGDFSPFKTAHGVTVSGLPDLPRSDLRQLEKDVLV
ncbi:MAG: hypothetical protein HYV00_07730 [Deltaproteobacteria bacterium]|nr:hypothetical protein [Deltaproteobacteria bacterium]